MLKNLAKFLKIKYSDSMLIPTMNDFLWKGNNFKGIKFKNVSSINVNKWKTRITLSEAMVIEGYLSDIMKKFGYNISGETKEHTSYK